MNIGIFDSGLGGLAIFKKILKKLPQYNYIYLGDNARVPYGGRSAKLIYDFTKQAVEFLFKKDCQLIILACNTSTAIALKRLQQEYLPIHYPKRRILGVIKPAIEEIIDLKPKRIGVIATQATVNSNAFLKEIKKVLPKTNVYQSAAPVLVPLIEEGVLNKQELNLIFKRYLKPLINENINTLLLGCTHYELIQKQIKKIVGIKIKVISEGKIVAEKLADYLKRHSDIEKKIVKQKQRKFYVTDLSQNYLSLAKTFLGFHPKLFYERI